MNKISKLIGYIDENPKLTKEKLTRYLIMFFGIIAGISANFGETLPAGVSGVITVLLAIWNTVQTSGLLETRNEIIYENTGKTVNEILDEKELYEEIENSGDDVQ